MFATNGQFVERDSCFMVEFCVCVVILGVDSTSTCTPEFVRDLVAAAAIISPVCACCFPPAEAPESV